MGHSITLKNGSGSQLKPREETIKFILDYSKALEVVKLKSGKEIEIIRN